MYMFLDVNSPLPGESISSAAPWESYYAAYLNRTFAVVEAFKDYPNTAAFFSGNEVIFDEDNGATVPPYIRAVTRDLKNYIAKNADRAIPVGYSAADVRSILFDSWNYLQCDDEEDEQSRVDLFALNSYSWCGNSTFKESGYDELVAGFEGSSVPIFFSEFGCNTPSPRVFTEVPEIYSDEMQNVFSGGIVYEYAQEDNNYGLVNISSDGSAQVMADYYALKEQYSGLNFTTIQGIAPSTKSSPAPKCSEKLITTKGFTSNFTVPALPPNASALIENGISPKPVGKIVTIGKFKFPRNRGEIDHPADLKQIQMTTLSRLPSRTTMEMSSLTLPSSRSMRTRSTRPALTPRPPLAPEAPPLPAPAQARALPPTRLRAQLPAWGLLRPVGWRGPWSLL